MERLPRQPWRAGLNLFSRRAEPNYQPLDLPGPDATKADQIQPLTLRDPSGWQTPSSYSGVAVNESSVMALSAVWACVNLLAGTIASLPLMVYRTSKDGQRELARDHPLYRVLHDRPNGDQTAVDFWESGNAALELRGNFFAQVHRIRGRVVALTPIWEVAVRRDSRGVLRYRWTSEGKSYDEPQDNVFHVRGFGGSPLGGLSTLSYGRQVFGLSSAINIAAQATFANGMRPSVALKTDKFLIGEQYALVEQDLNEKFVGANNAGRPFIAHGGMDIVPLTINPEDAQMLESRGFGVEEIARFFGVPPFMIGHTEKSSSWGTGLEQQTLGFQKFTLRRRLKRIEQAVEAQLLTPADRSQGVTVEFSLEGLLRGDSAARAAFYQSGLQNGWTTINEVRALENLPPVEGGNVPRMQMQNVPITEAGQMPTVPGGSDERA